MFCVVFCLCLAFCFGGVFVLVLRWFWYWFGLCFCFGLAFCFLCVCFYFVLVIRLVWVVVNQNQTEPQHVLVFGNFCGVSFVSLGLAKIKGLLLSLFLPFFLVLRTSGALWPFLALLFGGLLGSMYRLFLGGRTWQIAVFQAPVLGKSQKPSVRNSARVWNRHLRSSLSGLETK